MKRLTLIAALLTVVADTPARAHIRATAKPIPRTDADPKPLAPNTPAPKGQ